MNGARRAWTALTVLVALLLGGVAGWAGKTLLAPTPAGPAAPAYTLVEVVDDSVSRSIRLNAAAGWSGGATFPGGITGTVTQVDLRGAQTVRAGSRLFDVDLAPIVVAQGEVPAFRDLQIGASGADVEQLQRFLLTMKFRSAGPTGRFDMATANEVYAWKKSLGVPPSGTVEQGRLVFVPRLPARVALAPEVRVGAAVSASQQILTMLPIEPRFTIALPPGQAALARLGQEVSIADGAHTWRARIARLGEPSPEGTVVATLGPTSGALSICGSGCSSVPLTGRNGLEAQIVVVPEASGPVVPTSAIRVGADGQASVVDEAGTALAVQVRAAAGGLAVVDGVRVGTKIRAAEPTS